MANPITFKPLPVDPHLELERRLNAAPREHAEALLVVYDILQAAHDNGLLDTAHGLISARDTIFGKLAEYAKTPEGETGIRNLLAAAKVLASLDPEVLDQLSRSVVDASQQHQPEQKPPSLWQLFKRTNSEDGRRGLSFLTLLLSGLGRSLKSQ
ncbi:MULTISPECIES: DUF1641 domain-containing protein [Acidobacteriaceae]|uniref:DUF1641 domain-containing protein n=1 Tax=Acidobacteriaceae TaxID=204434 RepID=UPI00131BD38C|nr:MULTISPECIES: DUF1641 domain-containing protein [Acidobacteriaceae]MDW5266351.1 DUF1641 domain-containing protein [Edaphobacter sp.]